MKEPQVIHDALIRLRYALQSAGISEPYVIRLRGIYDLRKLHHALTMSDPKYHLWWFDDGELLEFKFLGFTFRASYRDDVQHRPQEAPYEEAEGGVPELAPPPLLLVPPADNE